MERRTEPHRLEIFSDFIGFHLTLRTAGGLPGRPARASAQFLKNPMSPSPEADRPAAVPQVAGCLFGLPATKSWLLHSLSQHEFLFLFFFVNFSPAFPSLLIIAAISRSWKSISFCPAASAG
jgi:hypothetical protein